MKKTFSVIKEAFEEWQNDKASRLAAALAFYAILSIPSLLVLIISIVGQFTGQETAQQAIIRQAGQVLGTEGTNAIRTILEAASQPTNLSLAAAISMLTLFFSASGAFVQLQDAMNTIWNVMPDPEEGIMNTIKKRFVSFGMILAVGVLFVLLLLASSIVALLGNTIAPALPDNTPVISVLNGIVGLLIMTGIFGLMYKTLPDAEIAWRDVWLGAAVTAVLFVLGIILIGVYLQFSDPTSSYGAAGSIIVLMIWIYYSAQIFFLGAEFTQVYANKYGSRILPEEGAVQVERVTKTSDSNPSNGGKPANQEAG